MSTSKLFEKLGSFTAKRSTLVLVATLLLLIPGLVAASTIGMEIGLDTFVSSDTDLYRDYETYLEAFPRSSVIVVLITGDVTDFQVLQAMSRLEETLEEGGNVSRVTSLSGVVKNATREFTGNAHIPTNQAEIEQIIAQLPQDVREGLMPDKRHTFVLVEMPATIDIEIAERTVTQVENAVDWADFPPSVDLVVTGEPALGTQMKEEMSSGLNIMILAASLLMVVILWLVFSHVRWRLLPFAGVIIGVIWTFGATGLFGVPLTMVSMAVFPLLIGIGIDYSIQLHNRIDEEVKQKKSARMAVSESLKNVTPALGIAVLAAVLGYSALFISPLPMIRQFGMMSLIGIILCCLAAVFFLTPLLYKLYHRAIKGGNVFTETRVKKEGGGRIEQALGKVSVASAKYPVFVLVVVVLLTILGYTYDQKVGITLEERDFVPSDMPAIVQMKRFESLVERTMPLTLLVRGDDVTSPKVLNWMDEFGEYEIERRDEVKSASSIASLIKQVNGGSIPNTNGEISMVLEKIPEQQKAQYISGRGLAVLNLDTVLEMTEGRLLIDGIEQDLAWKQPPAGVRVSITGQMVLFSSIWDAMTTGRLRMTFIGAMAILLGLLAIYRDWLRALLPVVPVALATGLAGGAMYILGIKYTPLAATLGALIIGLGAEYYILVTTRYFEERKKGNTPIEAIRTSTSKVGMAILSSGATTAAGFAVLVLSGFPILESFAIITVVIFILLIVLTFTVLPALLVPLDRWRTSRRERLAQQAVYQIQY